jgi:hypothetical protein
VTEIDQNDVFFGKVSGKKGDVLIGATAWHKKRIWKRQTVKYSSALEVPKWCYTSTDYSRIFTDVSVSIEMARL